MHGGGLGEFTGARMAPFVGMGGAAFNDLE